MDYIQKMESLLYLESELSRVGDTLQLVETCAEKRGIARACHESRQVIFNALRITQRLKDSCMREGDVNEKSISRLSVTDLADCRVTKVQQNDDGSVSFTVDQPAKRAKE